MIYKYNEIDIKKIKFSDTPYNILQNINNIEKNIYYIDMYYNDDSLYIQLPKYKIYNYENNILKIRIDENFNDKFIKKIEEYIIKIVHKNSQLWFNGKVFTMNKIVNGIVRNIKYIKEQLIMTIFIGKECKFYNQYNIEISDISINNDTDTDIICIIKLDNLQFIDNKFTYNIVLEQAKIYNYTKIVEYSILDNSSEKCSSISTVSILSSTNQSSDNILQDEYYKD